MSLFLGTLEWSVRLRATGDRRSQLEKHVAVSVRSNMPQKSSTFLSEPKCGLPIKNTWIFPFTLLFILLLRILLELLIFTSKLHCINILAILPWLTRMEIAREIFCLSWLHLKVPLYQFDLQIPQWLSQNHYWTVESSYDNNNINKTINIKFPKYKNGLEWGVMGDVSDEGNRVSSSIVTQKNWKIGNSGLRK